jgi:hypothetical protein
MLRGLHLPNVVPVTLQSRCQHCFVKFTIDFGNPIRYTVSVQLNELVASSVLKA